MGWFALPRWLEQGLQKFGAAVAAIPVIARWRVRLAPARAISLLEEKLAWVHRLEDEALLLSVAAIFALLVLVASTPLTLGGQIVFAVAIIAAGVYLGRMQAEFASDVLAALSLLAILRYLWWRVDATLDFENGEDFVAGVVLAAVELVIIARLLSHYFRVLSGGKVDVSAGREMPAPVLPVLLLAPNLFLIFAIRPYAAPPLPVVLYLLPCMLLALLATARLDGVSRGWGNWVRDLVAGWRIPVPLAFAALNLAGLFAALPRAILTPDRGEVLFYAAWVCVNLWLLRTGGQLRHGYAHSGQAL
jgi:hypothetical protein